MQRIARAIQEGAAAYLNRQYTTIAVIGVILALVITFAINWQTGVLYVVGAVCSALASTPPRQGLTCLPERATA